MVKGMGEGCKALPWLRLIPAVIPVKGELLNGSTRQDLCGNENGLGDGHGYGYRNGDGFGDGHGYGYRNGTGIGYGVGYGRLNKNGDGRGCGDEEGNG